MNEPTLGEVMRRLDAVAIQQGAITSRIDTLLTTLDGTYVRKDVQSRAHADLERRLGHLERDREESDQRAADTRRQFVFLVLAIAIPAVVSLLLQVNLIVKGG